MRVFARSPRQMPGVEWAIGDLATGAGLEAALQGVHTVINAATLSPIARRGGIRPVDFFTSPVVVDVEGTGRLLAVSRRESVRHFLHVSIVGLEDASLPYARAKLAGERLVRDSALSWSVVRAMPFYYLLANLLARLSWAPIWPVPTTVFDPVDTSDAAAHVVKCALDGARGERAEIGGPDRLSGVELARQYLHARGMRRKLLPIGLSDKAARGMGFVTSAGVRGTLSWKAWLDGRYPGMQEAA